MLHRPLPPHGEPSRMLSRGLFAFLLLTGLATGEPDVIGTDNPSLTCPTHIVGSGTVQVESGLYYRSDRTGGPSGQASVRIQQGPGGRRGVVVTGSLDRGTGDLVSVPTLVRIGLSQDFELRFNQDLVHAQGKALGISDLSVGFKYRLIDSQEGPSLAVLGSLEVPTGSLAFQGRGVSPSLYLLTDLHLDEETFVVANLGGALSPNGSGGNTFSALVGGAVYRTLSPEWCAYVELAGTGSGIEQTVLDAGLSYTVNADWVLNLAVYRGLSAQGMNWAGYVGYGARF